MTKKKKRTIKSARVKPKNFESSIPDFKKPDKVETGDGHHLDSAREIAKQKTGENMTLTRIKNFGKKALSIIGAIVGAATGINLGVSGAFTGDVIFDVAVLAACLVIIIFNGKDGVPEWMINLFKTKNKK